MVCKLKTGKFRLGIAFYHWTIWSPLPRNGREGLELVSKRCDFTNGTRISVSNIPYGKGTTFSDIPLNVPGNFPLERPKQVLFNLLAFPFAFKQTVNPFTLQGGGRWGGGGGGA